MPTWTASRTKPGSSSRLLSNFAASALRQSILEGELEPGERLRQDELIERFGVSSAPLREALRKLEAEGLVEHRDNRGVYVLGLSKEELLEVVEPTRILLEEFAVRKALETDGDGYLADIAAAVSRMAVAAEAGDLHAVNAADVAFHQIAIDYCDQPHTTQLWRSVIPRLHAAFFRLAPQAKSLGDIVDEHHKLIAAFESRDSLVISGAIREHALNTLSERAAAAFHSSGSRKAPPPSQGSVPRIESKGSPQLSPDIASRPGSEVPTVTSESERTVKGLRT